MRVLDIDSLAKEILSLSLIFTRGGEQVIIVTTDGAELNALVNPRRTCTARMTVAYAGNYRQASVPDSVVQH